MAKFMVTAVFINGYAVRKNENMSWGEAEKVIRTLGPDTTSKDVEDAVDMLRGFGQLYEDQYPEDVQDTTSKDVEDAINMLRDFWHLCEDQYPGHFFNSKDVEDAIDVLRDFWQLCEDQYPGHFLNPKDVEDAIDMPSDLKHFDRPHGPKEQENTTVSAATITNKQNCKVARCTLEHRQHFCLLCKDKDSDHFSSECPKSLTLFHGTHIRAIKLIAFESLKESTSGTLGPGIYFVENYEEAESISQYRKKPEDGSCTVVFECQVYLGNHVYLGKTPTEEWQGSYDSASSIHGSWANIDHDFKEYCLKLHESKTLFYGTRTKANNPNLNECIEESVKNGVELEDNFAETYEENFAETYEDNFSETYEEAKSQHRQESQDDGTIVVLKLKFYSATCIDYRMIVEARQQSYHSVVSIHQPGTNISRSLDKYCLKNFILCHDVSLVISQEVEINLEITFEEAKQLTRELDPNPTANDVYNAMDKLNYSKQLIKTVTDVSIMSKTTIEAVDTKISVERTNVLEEVEKAPKRQDENLEPGNVPGEVEEAPKRQDENAEPANVPGEVEEAPKRQDENAELTNVPEEVEEAPKRQEENAEPTNVPEEVEEAPKRQEENAEPTNEPLYKPWYFKLKAFSILFNICNGIWSVYHLHSKSSGNIRDVSVAFAVLFSLHSLASMLFTYRQTKLFVGDDVKNNLNLTFLLEMPMLTCQAYVIMRVENMVWSDLNWDVSMQIQFIINFILFMEIDVYFLYRADQGDHSLIRYILLCIGTPFICSFFLHTPIHRIFI